jgi:hypothetical protein
MMRAPKGASAADGASEPLMHDLENPIDAEKRELRRQRRRARSCGVGAARPQLTDAWTQRRSLTRCGFSASI